MPRKEDEHGLIQVIVTPRFEVFYALQALESGAGESLESWRRDTERRLPARLRTNLAGIAPCPLMWPLLADALRETPPAVSFNEMTDALRGMDERTFQSFVLGGVFKNPGSVDELVSGEATLSRIVAKEAKAQQKMLSLLGLHPFSRESASAIAFGRVVADAGAYRDEMVSIVESFWTAAFAETWAKLEPAMRDMAGQMRAAATRPAFPEFARAHNLAITIDDDSVVTSRTGARTPLKTASVYLVPSAFNIAKLWAAYSDARGRTRFFLPVLGRELSPSSSVRINPSLIFRALGDTTRYAIAVSLARKPVTSVELARIFGVSKPTISHHVQLLRAAGLLEETQTDNGVVLALDRRAIERLSPATVREMFSGDGPLAPIRRTRKPNS